VSADNSKLPTVKQEEEIPIEIKIEEVSLACDQCKYVATRIYDLRRHREGKHEGVRYPCDECKYAATCKSDLNRHMKSQHLKVSTSAKKCKLTQKNSKRKKKVDISRELDLVKIEPGEEHLTCEPDLVESELEPDLVIAEPLSDLVKIEPEPDLVIAEPLSDLVKIEPEPDLAECNFESDSLAAL